MNRLTPGCWIAHAFAEREVRGEAMSIEFLRAAMEHAPTYPEALDPDRKAPISRPPILARPQRSELPNITTRSTT